MAMYKCKNSMVFSLWTPNVHQRHQQGTKTIGSKIVNCSYEGSCDRKSNVDVHRKSLAVKWFQINVHVLFFPWNLLLLTVNIHRKSLVVKEMLDWDTSVFLQPRLFSYTGFTSVENDLLVASTSWIQSVVFCARLEKASEVCAMSW